MIENCSTFAEIKRTINENSDPLGSYNKKNLIEVFILSKLNSISVVEL